MDSIVGYTGFVGGNICESHRFDGYYNTQNISEAFGTGPDRLVYCGVRAEKYVADMLPEEDFAHIREAFENIRRINAKQTILVSTIDVLSDLRRSDEDSITAPERLDPYGRNRLLLEDLVREHCARYLIVRLPALFGKGLKKNFIYDMINPIPWRLSSVKYAELGGASDVIRGAYVPDVKGFYRRKDAASVQDHRLEKAFRELGFSTLSFTDSRASFQFYPLKHLWEDIVKADGHDISLLHLATEPVNAGELYRQLTGKTFLNEVLPASRIKQYDFITKHDALFGGRDGYILNAGEIIAEIRAFVGESAP